ncbi:MAG: prephenate dehydrogenase/arogenate dehydrogenase family protein [Verrucomicrobiota bacterium]
MDKERCVAVLGPGLLGGSVALAARERFPGSILIWGRRSTIREPLLDLGFDESEVTHDLEEVAHRADFLVLATPVGIMGRIVESLIAAGLGKEGSPVVTDVGSVKAVLQASCHRPLREAGVPFVGAHPMAGSEHAGLLHARANLFEGARCILTPGEGNPAEGEALVETFWRELGTEVEWMGAEDHDSMIARVSHLPHAAAAAIILAALDEDPTIGRLSGGGLKDTTRVAGGPAEMWQEILDENREAVVPSLESLQVKVADLLALLQNRDKEGLVRFLERARALRRGL